MKNYVMMSTQAFWIHGFISCGSETFATNLVIFVQTNAAVLAIAADSVRPTIALTTYPELAPVALLDRSPLRTDTAHQMCFCQICRTMHSPARLMQPQRWHEPGLYDLNSYRRRHPRPTQP